MQSMHGPRIIKQESDWRDVRRPQVAMHCNCHVF